MAIDVGSRLREYEIVAHLRVGGMATLYLGRRQGAAGFAKAVAIKVIHPHLARDQAFVSMFVDEALISARIEHPSVVHVEELGEAEGTYFLVMEYVHGVSLSQLLVALGKRGRRLSPALAVHIAAKVAEGLHAAHETNGDDGHSLGLVHRDVSPQNVLISSRGHVKLIDFGIAKARGRAQQTSATSLKGKIRYMSPEQAYGRVVDRRTDLYALGVVLWEMLTMQRMFKAEDDMALLDLVRNPQIALPSTLAPDIPPALDTAVMHALAADREYRTATGQDMRRELATALPEALSLDAANLAELVNAVLGKELDEERKRFPTNVNLGSSQMNLPPVALPPPTVTKHALESYTISDIRLAEQLPEDAVSPEQTSPPAVSVAVPMPTPLFTPPPEAQRRMPMMVVALGAVALLAVGGIGGLAAIHFFGSSEPETASPVITLPQNAVGAPGVQQPVLPPQTLQPQVLQPLAPIQSPLPLAVPDAGVMAHGDTPHVRHVGHGHTHPGPSGNASVGNSGNTANASNTGTGVPFSTGFDD